MRKILFCTIFLLISFGSLAQSYKIGHCYQGCPLGGSKQNHLIIRPIYALSYNTETKSADWVAYKVSSNSIGIASSLSRAAVNDQYVSDTLKVDDFIDSESVGLIRAQYVPLVDFAGTPYWNEVNYLTNIVARSSSLSQGAWYGLDWSIRNLVNRVGEVYVIAGPIYDLDSTLQNLITNNPHRVPDRFFKIVVDSNGAVAGFIMDQSAPIHLHHCEMGASLAEIEGLIQFDLFPFQSGPIEETAFSGLGCSP
ncbi:MAG: DNA/RNA non-specific endonuclease [Gammaproteobacteria bacterium]|nr:DNA/RNA non-specific endonuclease [Gammaproteobacteria bacterium]